MIQKTNALQQEKSAPIILHKLTDEEKLKGSLWSIVSDDKKNKIYTEITYKDKNGDGFIDDSEVYSTLVSNVSKRTGERFTRKNIDKNQDGIIDQCIHQIIRKDGMPFIYITDKDKGKSIRDNAKDILTGN